MPLNAVTRLIVVTDIFGRSAQVDQLCAVVTSAGVSCACVDPYGGISRHFPDESSAYAAFMEDCGHVRYAEHVRAEIERGDESDCVVVGFSAGASAAWKAASGISGGSVHHLIGFYPGQVRHYLDAIPSCPTTLVFPRHEAHFDVGELMGKLIGLGDVDCIQTPWRHGFMNPASQNYSKAGAECFMEALRQPELLHSIPALRQRWQAFSL